MIDLLAPVQAAVLTVVPDAHRRPIGIIGAGEITEVAHLPAYAAAGLRVAAISDLDRGRAEHVASIFGIDRVYDDAAGVAADPEVEVVDIAVYPWVQPDIARPMLLAGKHLLCQKPLALDLDLAVDLVDLAEQRGLQLAVNQQLRFDEGVAAARAMVELGWIGDPTAVTFDVHIHTPWENWPWVAKSERLDLTYHTIHYLDAVRSLLGDPVDVFGTTSRVPGQPEKGETRSISVLRYPGELRALLHVFHKNADGDPHARFRIDGTGGSIRGTLGLLYDYPRGRPDTLEVHSTVLPTDGWMPYPVTTRWLPDAFLGPMASLLAAVATGAEPATSGRDNLRTLQLVEALYASHKSSSVINLRSK